MPRLSMITVLGLALFTLPLSAEEKVGPAKRSRHWAFQPVSKVAPPEVESAWARTGIDRYILARLQAKGIKPAVEASREVLIRRAYFDLIGLPPSPEEVAAFVADPASDAYEQLVDRLLASPHYGERWGRHWLDLARYADSGGFHNDLDRPHAWRYRDYVIRSFNEDRPYGRFIKEQLAGDEIAPDSPDAIVATGFCRNGPSNDDNMGKDPIALEEYRLDQLDDVLSTASEVFLGLTLGCARCHDHKYDPITQRDYYRMLAIFNTTDRREVPLDHLPVSLEEARKKASGKPKKEAGKSVPTAMALVDASGKPRTTYLLLRGNVRMRGPEVGPGVPAVLVGEDLAFPVPASGATSTGRRRVLAEWIASEENPLTWRVLANRMWQYHFGRGLVPTSSNFGKGGEPPTHPELLDWLAGQLIENGGRLKPLHRQIMLSAVYRQTSRHDEESARVDPENQLWWHRNIRRLEAEPVRDSILAVSGTLNRDMGGPGIKPRIPHELLTTSQRNKWPKVEKEGPAHWRRSVYIYVKRQLLMPLMELLDAPSSTLSCSRRTESTVPTQALTLLNGDLVNDQARHFAQRVLKEAGAESGDQAERALWLALCRQPEEARIRTAAVFLEEQRQFHQEAGKSPAEASTLALTDLGVVLFNSSEFPHVD